MIVLDTHIWLWWVHGTKHLTEQQAKVIKENESRVIGVSSISCWEIAKLVEYGRLELPKPIKDWFKISIEYPGLKILEITPEIAMESTQLPGEFHKDPADQIIVATARINNCPLVTSDRKMLEYPHIKTIR